MMPDNASYKASPAASDRSAAEPGGPRFLGVAQLSLRAVVIAMIGSAVITASSMYVALKLSALPWPTIFVAVLSMALLKVFGRTSLNEINIAQTGMSAGAMVAGGLAFTLPGLWISGIYPPYSEDLSFAAWFWPKFWPVLLVALAGMILGSLLCWVMRPRFIDQEQLPYPIGTACAETLEAGDSGGIKARILFITMGLAALFTYLRDKLALLPQAVGRQTAPYPFFLALSPMAVGIGFIIGPVFTVWWFAGALIAAYGIPLVGTLSGTLGEPGAASAFILTAAIGLMVGSGVGILISFIVSWAKRSRTRTPAAAAPATDRAPRLRLGLAAVIAVALAYAVSVAAGIPPFASVLLMLGVLMATAMSANITGLTGINPMEIFGIIVLLAIRLIANVPDTGAFLIAGVVAVACGYAGDLLNDYKAGALIGTNPTAQFISQLFGGVIGTLVASIAMFAVIYQYGGVGAERGLPAAQAFSVTAMVRGIGDPTVFLVAAILGCALYLLKIPAMIVGIGMLLPFGLSLAILLGGLASLVVRRTSRKPAESAATGNVIAAGLLGGEGITGVIIAFIAMLTK